MDPKPGILHFVTTSRIAGGDGPGDKDMKFFGPTDRDIDGNPIAYAIQNMSDLAAELADYHLDAGKTMGIRRIIFDSFAYQLSAVNVTDVGGPGPTFPNNPIGNALASTFGQGTPFLFGSVFDASDGQPGGFPGGDAWQAVFAQEQSLFSDAGGAQVQTIERVQDVFRPSQFLLLNLNFKSPIAQTPAAKIKWTFPNKVAREADGVFVTGDIGKVALQDDEKSWWVLKSFANVDNSNLKKPSWDSQDLRSQIASGCFNSQLVLFFLPDGTDGTYFPLINPYHKFATPGHPVRDVKDQRRLYQVYGDGGIYGWVRKGRRWGSVNIPDRAFGAGFVSGRNQDNLGTYPAGSAWLSLVHNAPPPPGGRDEPRAGGLGIYDSQAAFDAAATSFKNSDVGAFAIVLLTQPGPFAYSPNQTTPSFIAQLTGINPPTFSISPPSGGGAAQFTESPGIDIPYELYYFRDDPHADPIPLSGFRDIDQTYGSQYNPLIRGNFRLRNHEAQNGVFISARFLNTD